MEISGKIKQQLITALLANGQKNLADTWGCTASTVSKRLESQQGIKIEDLADALAQSDINIINDPDYVVVHKDEIKALNLMAKRYLDKRTDSE